MAGWYGEEVELRRRITHAHTMIRKVRSNAEVKIEEYEDKIDEWQEKLDALEAKKK